jgi:flagellar biosynthesis/type III secretory pathway M-ring protein FliF/YscJ
MNEAPTADGGPGFLAFVAFFLLALALWFLMRNMNARMRRMSYRQQAAHRGKDEPQVAPDELADEQDGPVAERVDPADPAATADDAGDPPTSGDAQLDEPGRPGETGEPDGPGDPVR